MGDSRIDSLSSKEREVLRLVPLNNTDEIARLTGLTSETVKTYINRACKKLGVNRRTDAARLLLSAEARPPGSGSPLRGTDEASARSPFLSAWERIDWRRLLPFRQQGATGNDLNFTVRLVWIVILAIALAIGFGMASVGVESVSNLIRGGR